MRSERTLHQKVMHATAKRFDSFLQDPFCIAGTILVPRFKENWCSQDDSEIGLQQIKKSTGAVGNGSQFLSGAYKRS
ncbi:hypothetical protein Ciccas_012934 [Cichlidogyrus casuarinus]|uniref:Uncharacterized protein n=1 Tax=Cichlidogyrus casuarinus TaxID=1844966 RepID=A0ABD2PNA0_9PLAT